MPLHPATRQLLGFLRSHPDVRSLIRAAPGESVFYAGSFVKPLWEELAEMKRRYPDVAQKTTLDDVLSRIAVSGLRFPNLLTYVQDVEGRVPVRPDKFVMWRALSGVYAANAVGKVSFQIGSGITADGRVFAATELRVLMRNPNVDETARDLLAYYERCIRSGEDINVGFISS